MNDIGKHEKERVADVVEMDTKLAADLDTVRATSNHAGDADSIASESRKNIEKALESEGKPWKHCRIMIIGEGRAGKTALSNSIMGRGYEETMSTVGIREEICDVDLSYASIGGGQWLEYKPPVKQLEHALASQLQVANIPSSSGSHIVSVTSVVVDTHGSGAAEFKEENDEGSGPLDPLPIRSRNLLDPQIQISQDIPLAVCTSSISPLQKQTAISADSDMGTSSSRVPSESESVYTNIMGTIDETLVKELGKTVTPSNIVVSVSDYGGQDVFYALHHLFMTRNAVYIVVFNMEWLLEAGPVRDKALSYLRFWINSITVHTYDSATGSLAPIAIVGTRKDQVSSPIDHAMIAQLIEDAFCKSRAWPSVVKDDNGVGLNNSCTTLCFFPVDNTKHRNDPAIIKLLNCVEVKMNESAYTHALVPWPWFRSLDILNARKSENKACLSLDEFKEIAKSCMVGDPSIILQFFHDMVSAILS